MNKMMAATISAGRGHPRGGGHGVAAEPCVDHPAADRDEDEEERPEQLGEQPPPLVAVVGEVKLVGDRVRLPHGPQGDVGAVHRRPLPVRLLPGRVRWPGILSGLAAHGCLSSRRPSRSRVRSWAAAIYHYPRGTLRCKAETVRRLLP